jgi:hypothetical protein
MSRIAQQAWWSIAPAPSEPPEYPDDDWLDEIEEEIWNTPAMLLDAVTDAEPTLTIGAVVRMHAERVREERREREEP